MADLIIRGMEMPKNGYECPMNSFGICHVATDGDNCECYDVRADWCPLVPIPEGHGRLIDADDLIDEMGLAWDYDQITNAEWTGIREWLNHAPTIVPAEGENADG